MKRVLWIIGIIVLLGLGVFLFQENTFYIKVIGKSMEPILHEGTFYQAEFVSSFEKERGEMVVFSMENRDKPFIKQLIGLPGDEFSYVIDGEDMYFTLIDTDIFLPKYKETGLFTMLQFYFPDTTEGQIPEGRCFVVGSNQAVSVDSLDFGFIKCEKIFAKIIKTK
ncbi:signal peptidase I [Candidatus Peregrinibacteria bacterium]|nr:MAG: signal peptidase I [Candidatus Peregrinibacteria bacterium]